MLENPSISSNPRLPRVVAVVLAVGLAVGGCLDRGAASPSAAAPPAPVQEPGQRVDAPRLRARVVGIDLVVRDVPRAAAALRRIVARREGWIAAATERRDDAGSASFDLRVPDGALAAFRADVRRMGEVTSDREEVEDVTDQVVDVEARLRVARREEERLLALLAERAGTIADVVALETRLAEVRERIERMDASAQVLHDRVEYARVHVEVLPRPVPYWKRPLATIADAGSWGWGAVQAVLVGGAAAIVGLGPTAVVLLALLIGLIAVLRSASRRLRRARA